MMDLGAGATPDVRSASATVVILSAGGSPYLRDVLTAVSVAARRQDVVHLVWSGAGAPPHDLPASVRTTAIAPASFDHGGTRQLALEECRSDFIAFLSDDAEPSASGWLNEILAPFADPAVAAVYGRQLPRPGASASERAFRRSRYPTESRRFDRTILDGYSMVVLPFSDANAAYRATALRALGGFPRPCMHAEDLVVALRLLDAGHAILYAAAAAVWHSHDCAARDLLRRGWSAATTKRDSRYRDELRSDAGHNLRFVARMLGESWNDAGLRGVGSVLVATALRGAGLVAGRVARVAGAGRDR